MKTVSRQQLSTNQFLSSLPISQSLQSIGVTVNKPIFSFQERIGYIDWKFISRLDIEKLKKDNDLDLLEVFIIRNV